MAMSTHTLLTSLFRYKAWADNGLMASLAELGADRPLDGVDTALHLLHHAHIVDRIFVANLQRQPHGYRATETPDLPPTAALFDAIGETDRWFVDYVERLAEDDAGESIEFLFTDGSPGRMSREEMLGHVLAHGSYHRGEIGRILTHLTGSSPRDTFTGFLHEAEPERRERAR